MSPETRTYGEMGSPMIETRSENRTDREERKTMEITTGGSITEAIGGIAAIVLSIIGLAAVYPSFMASISAIVVGAALLIRGCALTARYYSLLDESEPNSAAGAELGSGISAEVMGGVAGVVLGILALVNVAPMVLIPVSAIVLGGTLLLGCGSNARLNELVVENGHSHENGRRIAGDILAAANGAQALVGVAAIVLGIVGLCTYYQLVLSLVAFLSIGSSILLSGGTITGRMMTMLMRSTNGHHHHHHSRLGHAG